MNYYNIARELCQYQANIELNDKNRSTPIDIGKFQTVKTSNIKKKQMKRPVN